MSSMGTLFPSKMMPLLTRVALLVFVIASTFGMWHVSGIGMSENGEMGGCPLMVGMATLCNMNAGEHFAAWQRLFTAIPSTAGSLLASLFIIWIFFSTRSRRILRSLYDPAHLSQQSHAQSRLIVVPLDPLKEAFSRGILHQKIYG